MFITQVLMYSHLCFQSVSSEIQMFLQLNTFYVDLNFAHQFIPTIENIVGLENSVKFSYL